MFSIQKRAALTFILTPLAAAVANHALAEGFALEEVVVTAQKRSESIQDVPVAITAFTSEGMENMKM